MQAKPEAPKTSSFRSPCNENLPNLPYLVGVSKIEITLSNELIYKIELLQKKLELSDKGAALTKASNIKLNRFSKIALTLTSSTFFLYGLGQAPIFKNFLSSAFSCSGAG